MKLSHIVTAIVAFLIGGIVVGLMRDHYDKYPMMYIKAPSGYEMQYGYDEWKQDSTGRWYQWPKMFKQEKWYKELSYGGGAVFSDKNDTTWADEPIFIRKKR